MKQLVMNSMLGFSFDRPVTDNGPILFLKSKVHYQRLQAVPS